MIPVMTTNRKTIAETLAFSGIGIHSGSPCRTYIHPSESGGLSFSKSGVAIPVGLDFLVSAAFGLHFERDGISIVTPEHLLASLFMYGTTDAIIEVQGPEIPILDGSALPFVEALIETGVENLSQETDILRIMKKTPEIKNGDRLICVEPAEKLMLDVAVDYPHPAIGRQRWTGPAELETFTREIAPARTFGFLKDKETMYEAGFAKGASLENTLVFDTERLIQNQTLRFPDEPVRHKALDLIGDLALLGRPFQGKVTSFKGGHALSVDLLGFLSGTL